MVRSLRGAAGSGPGLLSQYLHNTGPAAPHGPHGSIRRYLLYVPTSGASMYILRDPILMYGGYFGIRDPEDSQVQYWLAWVNLLRACPYTQLNVQVSIQSSSEPLGR